MSDAPGDGRPGDAPEPYVPSGVRRSTYTPPSNDVEPPAFDDDALADALAAQVAPYTSPIPVTPPPSPVAPPPAAQSPATPEPPSVEEPAFEEPAFEEPVFEEPSPEEPRPVTAPAPVGQPADVPELKAEPLAGSSSTLEAIERLESELRRRAEEAQGAPAPTPETASTAQPLSTAQQLSTGQQPSTPPQFSDAPLFPAPPTYLRPAPPTDAEPAAPETGAPEPGAPEPGAPEPGASEPPTAFAPPPLVEPPAFAPPAAPAFGMPPATPSIDLPPPGAPAAGTPVAGTDFAHLPPPIGLEPAPLPPYDPTLDEGRPPTGAAIPLPPPGELAPLSDIHPDDIHPDDIHPDDIHPDDLGAGPIVAAPIAVPPGWEAPAAFALPSFSPESETPADDDPLDDDDVVDEIDRAFGTGAIPVDSTGAVTVLAPPSQPIPTVRLADDEPGLVDEVAEHHPALLIEAAGPEPTPLDLRAGRAARLFWLWFAANSSVISLSLGAVLFGLGMSLRQALVAILVGVALSFLPLGLVTLAGKWSGQPTMVVSRATFGLVGNALPAVFAVISRIFWGGALLWMLSAGVGRVLVDAGLDAGLGEQTWTLVGLGVGFALAFVVAIFGYGLLARLQLVLSIVTGILVVGLIVLTYPYLDISAAQGVADGPWILLVSGVVLVFSFVGLAWVHSSADVARYQRPDGDGGSTMLWATFGATLPAFLLLSWGAMLAASDTVIADGLATNPLHTIAALLPVWYPAPLIAALALGLLSAVVLTIYSGGFALQALGVGLRRSGTTVIAGLLVLVAAVALLFLVGDARGLIRDVATTIAVPVAAWAGIFATEMMIRRRRFHAESLLRRGGVYPAVRWVNVVGLVAIIAIGFGLTSAELPWLDWQGYLLPFLGLSEGDPLLTSDVGVLAALVLGILLPLVSAIPAIRRQEDASVD
jgi:purine-cytosine permease-like protein